MKLFFAFNETAETGNARRAVKVSLWLDPSQRVEHLKQELKRVCSGRFRYADSEIELLQIRDSLIRRWLVDPAPLSSLQNSNNSETSLLAFETAPSDTGPLVHIAVVQVKGVVHLRDDIFGHFGNDIFPMAVNLFFSEFRCRLTTTLIAPLVRKKAAP